MIGAAAVRRDAVFGEEIHRYVLASGLRVIVHKKAGFSRKFAVVGADYGSVDCAFVDRRTGAGLHMPEGIAHFLEHKLFEQEQGDAFEVFSRFGASANAATSFRSTSFFFTCSGHFEQNLVTLLGLVRSPYFTDASIEKEKGIISQEIRMYEDSPEWRSFIHLVEGLFVRHPIRVDITGTTESIERIDREKLLTCFANFYHPTNLCLVVSGDVEPDRVVEVAARAFPKTSGENAPERLLAREPRAVARRRIEETLAVPRPKLLLGFKDREVPIRGEALQKRDLVTAVLLALLFGSSSRTWQKLYEEGTIDDSFYTSYAGEEDFGFVTLGGESDEPERTRRALLREIRRLGGTGFDPEDFGRVVHKLLGRFVRGLDSQEGTAFLLLTSEFRGVDAFRAPYLLRTISMDDVMERHRRLFGDRNHCTSIVRPS